MLSGVHIGFMQISQVSIAIIIMGKRERVALLNLSSWCLVMVERLFLAVPRGCLRFVIVLFPDHTHLLFLPFWQSSKISSRTPLKFKETKKLIVFIVSRLMYIGHIGVSNGLKGCKIVEEI